MNRSAVGKSSISMSGLRLAARAARPDVSTAEVRRKLRRFIPGFVALMSVWRFGVGGNLRAAAQRMRTGRGRAAGEFRRVRVVAVHAELAVELPERAIPVAARAAMHAGFPIAIRR